MHFRLWSALCLTVAVLFFSGCSGKEEGPKACSISTDCGKGERCVRQVCKTIQVTNEPPVAQILKQKEEHRVRQNSSFELDGSKSADPDGDDITHAWTFVEKPEKSQATIDKNDQAKASFKADVEGIFIVQLVVTDTKQAKSNPARIKIEVYGKDGNGDPIANAGTDQLVGLNHDVKLNGANSSDPDGDELTYAWTIKSKPTGSKAQLNDPKSKTPEFKTDVEGKYIVELIVNDGLEGSQPDTVSIQARSDFELQPELTKIAPAEGFVDSELDLVLTGKGFSKDANVIFDGVALDAKRIKYTNETELKVKLSLFGKTPKEYEISVRNPNSKESKPQKFNAKPLPNPKITALSPNVASEGTQLEVRVKGTGFVQKTEILFQAVPLLTTYVSGTEVKVKLDLRQTLPGKYKVQARNPGNRSSDPVDFTVIQPGPPPKLRVLNPPFAKTGTKLAFSIHGIGFSPNAVILFDGKPLPSKRIRRDQINADPELDLTSIKPGKYAVQALNQDGQKSNTEIFVVEDKVPTPVINRILPFFVYLGGPNKLGVYGTGFAKGASLIIGNNTIGGTNVRFRSSTYIEVDVDTTKGTWTPSDQQAKVKNPSGKTSNGFKVTVAYRVPSISSVTPNGWVNKCNTTVKIFGNNFVKTSKVLFGSTTYTTTSTTHPLKFISEKELSFQLIASKVKTGTHNIYVDNGPKARSTAAPFMMQSASSMPVPEISSSRPSAAAADTEVTLALTASGSKYAYRGAIVYFDGKPMPTSCQTFGSSTRCYSFGVKLDLTGVKPGTHHLTVANPCGAQGKKFPFLVTDAPKPYIGNINPPYAFIGEKKGFVLTGSDFSKRAQIIWGGKNVATKYKDDKQISTTNMIDFASAKAGDVDVQVDNGNNNKSQAVKFSVLAKGHKLLINTVSTRTFDRGKIYNNLTVAGAGFTAKTEFYFNGKKITAKFSVPSLVTISGVDFQKVKAGVYYLYAKEGSLVSNKYPLFAKPYPPPVMDRISPNYIFEGTATTYISIYGSRFCKPNTSRRCTSNPKIVIAGPSNKDYSSNYRITYTYVTTTYAYVRGPLTTSSMPVGNYKIYFELPTGERSAPALFEIRPTPPPIIQRFNPAIGYAGTSFSLRMYALHFCPRSGTRCSKNPTLSITGSGLTNYAANFKVTSFYQSSPTYGYLYGTFDAKSMKAGTYKFQLTHPTSGKKSNIMSFTLKPPPSPEPQRFSPAVGYAGTKFSLTLYINHFCPAVSRRCSPNPSVSITSPSNPLVNYGTNFKITYTYVSSPTYGYMRGEFDATKMKPGTYNWVITHPTNKRKSVVTPFILKPTPDPQIRYLYRRYARTTSTTTHSLYGYHFDKGAKAYLDGKIVPTTYSSPTFLRITMRANTHKAGYYKVTVKNGNGRTSAPFIFPVISGTTPTVTMVTAPIHQGDKLSMYFYGINWNRSNRSPTIQVDGKTVTGSKYCYVTSTSYQYCRFSNYIVNLKPGTHTAVYVDGTKKSAPYTFYVLKLPPPELDYTSPNTITQGSTKYTLRVYGRYYTTGSVVRIGLNTYKPYIQYSTYMYIYIDTTKLKKGVHKVNVINPGNQVSNSVNLTIQ